MNKIRVIDLLNKIANGEEIKAKLKFKLGDIIINYYGMNNYSRTPEYDIAYIDKGCTTHNFTLGTLIKSLNDEVEIIEEEKKLPEKIKIDNEDRIQALSTGNFVYKVNQPTKNIIYKINEIIDYLQSKGE